MKRTIRVVPIEQKGGAVPKKNFRGSPFIRNTPEYDIILKLGRIKGYDENRRIRGSDGTYIPGSDISMLLDEATNPKRVLVGMEDFVKLLVKAKVNPEAILNDNVRSKLESYKRSVRIEDDTLSIPPEEVVRTSTATDKNIRSDQPSIRLDRINLEDYNHLLGRGKERPTRRGLKCYPIT
jgi:hypothetical protein